MLYSKKKHSFELLLLHFAYGHANWLSCVIKVLNPWFCFSFVWWQKHYYYHSLWYLDSFSVIDNLVSNVWTRYALISHIILIEEKLTYLQPITITFHLNLILFWILLFSTRSDLMATMPLLSGLKGNLFGRIISKNTLSLNLPISI